MVWEALVAANPSFMTTCCSNLFGFNAVIKYIEKILRCSASGLNCRFKLKCCWMTKKQKDFLMVSCDVSSWSHDWGYLFSVKNPLKAIFVKKEFVESWRIGFDENEEDLINLEIHKFVGKIEFSSESQLELFHKKIHWSNKPYPKLVKPAVNENNNAVESYIKWICPRNLPWFLKFL